jgi:hypothetical protein
MNVKKLLLAAATAAAITMSAEAKADGAPSLTSFDGWQLCSEMATNAMWARTIWWLSGFWSGENANGPANDNTTGDGFKIADLQQYVWTECANHPTETIQLAAENVYSLMRAKNPAWSSSGASPADSLRVVTAGYNDGSYTVTGTVNGTETRFIVDTGAQVTTINVSLVAEVGAEPTDKTVEMVTADGAKHNRSELVLENWTVG